MAGWTRSVRPSARVIRRIKLRQMRAYHLPGPPSLYQEDHLVPLGLGGAPADPRNLWPEPIRQARVSDRLENSLHRDVCAHRVTLRQGRQLVVAFKRRYG